MLLELIYAANKSDVFSLKNLVLFISVPIRPGMDIIRRKYDSQLVFSPRGSVFILTSRVKRSAINFNIKNTFLFLGGKSELSTAKRIIRLLRAFTVFFKDDIANVVCYLSDCIVVYLCSCCIQLSWLF